MIWLKNRFRCLAWPLHFCFSFSNKPKIFSKRVLRLNFKVNSRSGALKECSWIVLWTRLLHHSNSTKRNLPTLTPLACREYSSGCASTKTFGCLLWNKCCDVSNLEIVLKGRHVLIPTPLLGSFVFRNSVQTNGCSGNWWLSRRLRSLKKSNSRVSRLSLPIASQFENSQTEKSVS